MSAEQTLNSLLVNLFRDIKEIEERKLITDEFSDITYNDMHVIEAIGLDGEKRMSRLSELLNVTLASITTAVDALCDKGYAVRERSSKDKRVVFVKLTERGKRAYDHHKKFHDDMIKTIIGQLDSEECEVLTRSMQRLMEFFNED